MSKIHLVKIQSTIELDSYKNGIIKSTGCGLDDKVGVTFKSMPEMFNYLKGIYGLSEDKKHYEIDLEEGILFFNRLVADHNDKQNGGWLEPTKEEIQKWKKEKLNLYTETFIIKVITKDNF